MLARSLNLSLLAARAAVLSFIGLLLLASAPVASADDLTDPYARQVQQMYVAYYGRPGDPSGVEYWAGRLAESGGNWIADLIDAFGNSAEYTDRFSNLSSEDLIDNLYKQLFNRTPDQVGRDFYIDLLNGSNVSGFNPSLRTSSLAAIALDIANGTINDDAVILGNKLHVSTYFTSVIRETGRLYTFDDISRVVYIIARVSETTGSVSVALADIDGFAGLVPTVSLSVTLELPDTERSGLQILGLDEADASSGMASVTLTQHGISSIMLVGDQGNLVGMTWWEGDTMGAQSTTPLSAQSIIPLSAETTAIELVRTAPINWTQFRYDTDEPTPEQIRNADGFRELVDRVRDEQAGVGPDVTRLDNEDLYNALFSVVHELVGVPPVPQTLSLMQVLDDLPYVYFEQGSELWLGNPRFIPYGLDGRDDSTGAHPDYPWTIEGREYGWYLQWPPIDASPPIEIGYPLQRGRMCAAKHTPQEDGWAQAVAAVIPFGGIGFVTYDTFWGALSSAATQDELILRKAQLQGLLAFQARLYLNTLKSMPGIGALGSATDLAKTSFEYYKSGQFDVALKATQDLGTFTVAQAGDELFEALEYEAKHSQATNSFVRKILALSGHDQRYTAMVSKLLKKGAKFLKQVANAPQYATDAQFLWDWVHAPDYVCYEFDAESGFVEEFDPLRSGSRWEIGSWGECMGSCEDNGTQVRTVDCIDEADNIVSDSLCPTLKPDTSQPCVTGECPVVSGLVAHYPFDGDANNNVGSGNNGIVNGAVLIDGYDGSSAGAYQFDGINDSVEVQKDDALWGKTFTIGVWAKMVELKTESILEIWNTG